MPATRANRANVVAATVTAVIAANAVTKQAPLTAMTGKTTRKKWRLFSQMKL